MRRPGFTLIEILVVLAVIIALAAVIIPQVAGRADATPTAVVSTLSTASGAIGQFKADVRRYPGQLTWLSTTTGTPTDICGNAIPTGLLNGWSGPYIQRQIGAGIPAGDATILGALERADPPATDVSSLILKAVDVTRDAAEEIDAQVDGTPDLTAGTIRWIDVAGDADTLYYYHPIRGC